MLTDSKGAKPRAAGGTQRLSPAGRALRWLCGHDQEVSAETRLLLMATLLVRTASLVMGVCSIVLLAAMSAIRLPGAVWPLVWLSVEITLLAVRLRIMAVARQRVRAGDDRAFYLYVLYVAAALSWCVMTGWGTCECILSGDGVLIALAGINVSGIAAGVSSRSAAYPRLAVAQICIVSIPMAVGAAFTSNHWFSILALQIPLCVVAMSTLAVSHHNDSMSLIRAESENRYLARHDPLTGLPNRKQFADELEQHCRELAGAAADGRPAFGLLCLDVDGFKAVNDTYGHPAGDRLLTIVAERLRAAVRASDLVARLGGDEFVALLPSADEVEAREIAARIIASMAQPLMLGTGIAVSVGITIGIAIAPEHGRVAGTILARADAALYSAKRAGGGRSSVFAAGPVSA